jgi:DNA-binding transcriptional MerR regulator
MAHQEPIRKRPPGPRTEIPDKLYFRIGEVAKLCEVPAYVLRFWEGEFPQLKPNKGGTGQRLYRRRDVEMALRIKTLLYDEGYTIAGARQAFKSELRAVSRDAQPGLEGIAQTVDASHLQSIQRELRDLLAQLSRPATSRPAVQSIRPARPQPTPRKLPPPTPFPRPHQLNRPKGPTLYDSLFDDLPPEA